MQHKSLRLLVEFSHPAQVHKFKHVIRCIEEKGGEVLVLSRDKDVMLRLLEAEGICHVCISHASANLIGMAFELIRREILTVYHFIKFKPTMVLSAHSVAIVHAAFVFRVPSLVHDDTEHARLQQSLYMSFASRIVTSSVYEKSWGNKHDKLNSLEPLAYLHPNVFSADSSILSKYGLSADEPYAVVRFISWNAAHDIGLDRSKRQMHPKLIDMLRKSGIRKIVLSTEGELLQEYGKDIVRIVPEDLHHVLAFSRVCYTEGGSIAYESAVLGVPTVLMNPLQTGLLHTLEKMGLLVHKESIESVLDGGEISWGDDAYLSKLLKAKDTMLREYEDMAKLLCEYILNMNETEADGS